MEASVAPGIHFFVEGFGVKAIDADGSVNVGTPLAPVGHMCEDRIHSERVMTRDLNSDSQLATLHNAAGNGVSPVPALALGRRKLGTKHQS